MAINRKGIGKGDFVIASLPEAGVEIYYHFAIFFIVPPLFSAKYTFVESTAMP